MMKRLLPVNDRMKVVRGSVTDERIVHELVAEADYVIHMAARNIMYDEADVMIAGGAEMAACGLGMGGFGRRR